MGRIIPSGELEIADITALKQALIDKLFEVATRMTGLPREDLIIRNSLPKTDFGLTNEYWMTPTLTANAWTDYFSKELADQRFAAFYGVANQAADPSATAIRFSTGEGKVKTVDVVQIEDLYTDATKVDGFFDEAIIYKHKQVCNVEVYSKAAVSEPLILKALICEPAGKITF